MSSQKAQRTKTTVSFCEQPMLDQLSSKCTLQKCMSHFSTSRSALQKFAMDILSPKHALQMFVVCKCTFRCSLQNLATHIWSFSCQSPKFTAHIGMASYPSQIFAMPALTHGRSPQNLGMAFLTRIPSITIDVHKIASCCSSAHESFMGVGTPG